MSDLPVNIDSTYSDDPGDPTRKLHQQHHDRIHQIVNLIDDAAAASGEALVWDGSKYVPTSIATTASMATADAAVAADAATALSTHDDSSDDAHNAVVGTSKICLVRSPTGTASGFFLDEESTPSTGEYLGDIRFSFPDGFFT